MTYTVGLLLLIYFVTCGWPRKWVETCRQSNNKVNTHKTVVF